MLTRHIELLGTLWQYKGGKFFLSIASNMVHVERIVRVPDEFLNLLFPLWSEHSRFLLVRR